MAARIVHEGSRQPGRHARIRPPRQNPLLVQNSLNDANEGGIRVRLTEEAIGFRASSRSRAWRGSTGFQRSPRLTALLILTAACLVFVCGGCGRAPQPEALEIGSAAPAFDLPGLDGKKVSLDSYKGKIVLLDFWATWCGPCRMTMPVLDRLQKEYPGDMTVLAINLQEPSDVVQKYVREQGLAARVLLDESGTVGETYGTGSIPMQVLVDRAGIVRHIQLGFHPGMASQLRAAIEKARRG